MTVALIALCLTTLALLVIQERQRRDHRDQLDALLARIESPVLTKPEPKIEHTEDIPAVGFDDDDAFWKAREVTHGGS